VQSGVQFGLAGRNASNSVLRLSLNIAVAQALLHVQPCARVWVPLTCALGPRVAHRLLYAPEVFI